MSTKIENLISQLTLEEKAALCSGVNFWETTPISRLGVPSVYLSDGPHGVRREVAQAVMGNLFQTSVPATCFPPAVTLASTWDKTLVLEVGNAIAEECMEQGVSTILGPGINIKRSPLCGRNFEYFSEDPYLSGEMATSYINGVQQNGIGTSIKHFAVNSQEYRRLVASSEVDERTLREIYLAGFEAAIKHSEPYTVMCSYNPINGIHASDNKRLLWDILREEWGYRGIVVSDWGAVNDRVKGIVAGMDLEMPSSNGIRDKEIIKAVNNNTLDIALLDNTVRRILEYVFKCASSRLSTAGYIADYGKHHITARKVAANGSVLLKNNNNVMPLNSSANFAVVGQLSKKIRFQGGGSSRLNPKRLVSFCDYLDSKEVKYTYSAGYSVRNDDINPKHMEHAVLRAKDKDYVLAFIGLTDMYESESFDRSHLDLPASHNALIDALCEVNDNVIVVLNGGSPVVMPWLDKVSAVLNVYLGGEAGGEACYDVLYGTVNPSGKLAETYPNSIDDVLSTKYFRMGPNAVEYREGIYVGYRYFDTANKDVLFPFGYGLSYTTFEFSKLRLSSNKIKHNDTLQLSFNIKNTGKLEGAEVAQVYIRHKNSRTFKANKELKGFEKVNLTVGETKTVRIELDSRAFAFYNTAVSDWTVEPGDYEILIGSSSRHIHLQEELHIDAPIVEIADLREVAPIYYDIASANDGIEKEQFEALMGRKMEANEIIKKGQIDFNTLVGDLGVTWFGKFFKYIFGKMSTKAIPKDAPNFERKMVYLGAMDMPVRNFFAMTNGLVPYETCVGLLIAFNGHTIWGLWHAIRAFLKKNPKKKNIYKK